MSPLLPWTEVSGPRSHNSRQSGVPLRCLQLPVCFGCYIPTHTCLYTACLPVAPLPHPQAEVSAASNALGQLGGRLVAVEDVESRWEDGRQRTALVVAKAGPTPAKFPRQAGTPNKKPL